MFTNKLANVCKQNTWPQLLGLIQCILGPIFLTYFCLTKGRHSEGPHEIHPISFQKCSRGGVCHLGVGWSVTHPSPPPLHATPHPWNIFGKKWDGFHGVLHYVSLLVDKNRLGKSAPIHIELAPICIESAPIISQFVGKHGYWGLMQKSVPITMFNWLLTLTFTLTVTCGAGQPPGVIVDNDLALKSIMYQCF